MAGSTAKEFFGDSAQRSADWVRYGDTKAGVVVVALGVGLVNLLDNAEGLIDAHKQAHPSWVGWVATVCFYLALVAAGVGVLWMAKALFPALGAPDSLYYFRTVAEGPEAELKELNAERGRERLRAAQKGLPASDSEELKQWSAADFQAYVVDLETQKKLDERLLDDTAAQAWKLADIALNKARLTRTAYWGAFAFLILWPFARFMDALAH